MLKWLQKHLRIIIIVYIVESSIMAIAGLVLALMYDFAFGSPFLIVLGLFQLFVGTQVYRKYKKSLSG